MRREYVRGRGISAGKGRYTFATFHSFPASVPGPSYASGSGPVNSWYEDGAATM
jgi:hypothetical protein